jgi:hypothetical protein
VVNTAEVVALLRSLADQATGDARELERLYGRGCETAAFARGQANAGKRAADIVTRELIGQALAVAVADVQDDDDCEVPT